MIVHTLLNAQPPIRTDEVPWNRVRIEESATEGGSYTTAATQALSPLDSDPEDPATRDLTFTSDLVEGYFRLVFLDDDDNESVPTDPVFDDGTAIGALYATPGQLRDELSVDTAVLSNAEANRILDVACNLIDEMLGARSVDLETGRKVDLDLEYSWQGDKLALAAVKLGAFLFRNPNWESEQRVRSSSGDVSVSGPYGSPFPEVAVLLNQSGLRRLTTSTGQGSRVPIANLPEPRT